MPKKEPLYPHVSKSRKQSSGPKPTREDVRVEVWEERDRLHIGIQNKETGEYLVSWWDDEARDMFKEGFFESGRGLEESVLDYAEEMGILAKESSTIEMKTWNIEFRGKFQRKGRNEEEARKNAREFLEKLVVVGDWEITKITPTT